MKNTAKRPMREVPRSGRASVAHRSVAANRVIGAVVHGSAGYFFLVPLSVFFWLIFYQNLPDYLNGVEFKPISTIGAIDRTIKIGMIAISCALIATRWPLARLLL